MEKVEIRKIEIKKIEEGKIDKGKIGKRVVEYINLLIVNRREHIIKEEDIKEMNEMVKEVLDYVGTREMSSSEKYSISSSKMMMKYKRKDTEDVEEYFRSVLQETVAERMIKVIEEIRKEIIN